MFSKRIVSCLFIYLLAASAVRADIPKWLPRYDWDIRLDTEGRLATVKGTVTWTNTGKQPAKEIVFNAHGRYTIADKDVGFLAKMVELLRLAPSESMPFGGPAMEVHHASTALKGRFRHGTMRSFSSDHVINAPAPPGTFTSDLRLPEGYGPLSAEMGGGPFIRRFQPDPSYSGLAPRGTFVGGLMFRFDDKNSTALIVPLNKAVEPGESVNLHLEFTFRIPPKKGRWGQWDGVTTLAQWLPTVAVFGDKGWDPAPFIPWHQPFHNEAGVYNVNVTLPANQKLACSSTVKETRDLGDGWQQIVLHPTVVRDFALIASERFVEQTAKVGDVTIRCLHLPEHEHYGRKLVQVAAEALPVYNQWFGKYPYSQFTIVESFFGWNGNECGSLVMIDSRMMGMPVMAHAYLDYLLSHELCHQWWYNVVGTNGYAETWMDEGLATYFSHRLIDRKLGKNNNLLEYPRGLGWLPNIQRDDFRNIGMIGARARGEIHPTVQEMPNFKHLVNLSATTYDRGSKIVGLIEERLGEAAFLDFMRLIYRKYQFRILRVADFQRELEAYTRRSWDDFFRHYVYGSGMSDWAVTNVEVSPRQRFLASQKKGSNTGVQVKVHLEQKEGTPEPTVLGVRLDGKEGYQLRIPIHPEVSEMEIKDQGVAVRQVQYVGEMSTARKRMEVDLTLPHAPVQIAVDPDHILLDSNPTNNTWKSETRVRLTPLATPLDEADVTNCYDRWNIIAGPWLFGSIYNDPWYIRSPLFGLRASVYRTQQFQGGAFLGYRANDRNVVAGVDGLWDHCLHPNFQIGFNAEHSIANFDDDPRASRGVIYGRYVLMYGSSLYLPPFEYVEAFAAAQQHPLPTPRHFIPGAEPFDERYSAGVHYHKYLLTPYWDPEGGFALDASYQAGFPIFDADHSFHAFHGQVSTVKYFPKMEWLGDGPIISWLRDTRFAFRLAGGAAMPGRGLFFSLGGGDYFRGYDLNERQGSLYWLGSVEWRVPICKNLTWDFVDHVAGVRNIYLAPFYDVGDMYVSGHSQGDIAHAVGLGLRVDMTWLGLIERTTIRLDVAKTLNDNAPVQFWFGIQHPF